MAEQQTQEQQMQEQQPNSDAFTSQDVQQFKEGYQLAKQFLYQKPVFDAMVEEVQNSNPENTISGTVVSAMLRVQEEVGQFSLPAAAALGIALIDDVVEALEKAGILENTQELQTMVMQESVMLWLQANNYPAEEVAEQLRQMGVSEEEAQQVAAAGQQQGAPQAAGPEPQGGGMPQDGGPQPAPQQPRGLIDG